MIHGLALPQSVEDQHLLGAALDKLPSKPAAVALWARGLVINVDGVLALDRRDITPLIYATSHGMSYPDILAGKHDGRIDIFARYAKFLGPVVVRWDQEPNGGFGAPWTESQGVSTAQYRTVFHCVSERVRRIAPNVQMAYCIAWRGREHAEDFGRFYPGDACQVVGFDSYIKSPDVSLPKVWESARRTIRETTDKPCWVFEWGIAKGVPHRARILRTVRGVRGIAGAVYFSIDLPERGHYWAMTPAMEREFARLTR